MKKTLCLLLAILLFTAMFSFSAEAYGLDADGVDTSVSIFMAKLKITKQPKSVTVAKGKTATVTVTATGDGLKYQWYYKDAGSAHFKKTDTFTGNTYTAKMNATRNGRQIYCVITDKNGKSVTTNVVTLHMEGTPKITQQPVTTTVAKGKTAKVTVAATGEGLKYTWYFKDAGTAHFEKTTTFKGASYSLKMNAARNGRQLYCVITDKNGNSVATDIVTIHMSGTPMITKQPVSDTAAKGKTAKVTVTATGDDLTYTWYYKDAGALYFEKTDTFKGKSYSVKMNAQRNGRQVYCVITDKNGDSVKSDIVTIYMSGTPMITRQPEFTSVAKGETAKLTVTASGDGLKYAWYYKDAGATSFKKTNTFKGNTYTAEMTAKRNGRQIYCVITDKNGDSVKTDIVTIHMKGTPLITRQPQSASAAKDKTATVTFTAEGEGLTYKWYYKNADAKSFKKTNTFKGNTYTAEMDSDRHARQIYCVVTDKNGNSVKTDVVTIYLKGMPVITKQPQSVTVGKGETAKVTIAATGENLTYTWYYKNAGSDTWKITDTFKGKTYKVPMNAKRHGRQLYCVVTDEDGQYVASEIVTISMKGAPTISKQPSSVTVSKGQTAKVTFTAKGEGLTYTWYYKDAGAKTFKKTNTFKGNTYTAEMTAKRDGRQIYCVVTDKYGRTVATNVVTISMEHNYGKAVTTKKATCTTDGEKVYTCQDCGKKKVVVIAHTGHDMLDWEIHRQPTAEHEGVERKHCDDCTYYKDRPIAKQKKVYTITANTGAGETWKIGVGSNGLYTLEEPQRPGYIFKGWVDSNGKTFSSSGTVKKNVKVKAVWQLDGTDSLYELIQRTDAGTDVIKITANIVVDQPIYISYETKIYADGDYTITRAPGYKGDIFVVGRNRAGDSAVWLHREAILTLGGGNGTLTIDGNMSNTTVDVVGCALFVADSATVNLYDGIRIINNKKVGNERVYLYDDYNSLSNLDRIGGAAITILNATVNMYGGELDNNIVATEYTIVDNADGTQSYLENYACGGAVFNRGMFKMYGGTISNSQALRGGGVYNDRYVYLYSGEISNNLATVYGGAIATSSSMNADTHIGTQSGSAKMIIEGNHSLRAGGAIYSNTSSPIIIYGNTEFINNVSDTSGGAIYTAGPLTIRNTKFYGNSCFYSGGAIYHQYTKIEFDPCLLEITGCHFEENSASLGAAVILSASDTGLSVETGTSGTITDSTFKSNHAVATGGAGNGGAIYITRNSQATISGCEFTSNTAVNNAGALAIHSNSQVKLSDSTFTDNTAVYGGAMYASSGSVVDMADLTFTGNSATFNANGAGGHGGAIYLADMTANVKNLDLHNNTCASNGGAIYVCAVDLEFDQSSEFTGNSAGGHGGVFYLTYRTDSEGIKYGAVLTVSDIDFRNNTAMAGGVVSIRTGCEAILTDVKLTNNTATGTGKDASGGGAVYVGYGALTLNNVTANGNTSAGYGGVVNAVDSTVTVNGGVYSGNSAPSGGMINAISSSDITITDANISNNESTYVNSDYDSNKGGGALNVNGGTLTVTDTVLSGNSSQYYGGAIMVGSATVDISNCVVTNSTGGTGAAMYLRSSCTTTIKDTQITDNTASFNSVAYANGGTLTMENVTASGNTSQTGGALNTKNATVHITASQFDENTSETNGGAAFFHTSDVTLSGVSFSKNTAANHGGAVNFTGCTATVTDDCRFTENTAGNHGGAVYAVYFKPAANEDGTQDPNVNTVLNMTGGIFEGNSALGGGAVSVRTGCEAYFDGTTFTGNSVSGFAGEDDGDGDGGGAIYVGFGTVELKDVTATGNTATGHGGFLDSYNATVTVTGGSYTENAASIGGAFSAPGKSTLTITDANISNNESTYVNSDYDSAKGGGAIAMAKGTLTISGTTFDANKTGYYGGALLVSGATVTIDGQSAFTNSTGYTGAAMHFSGKSNVTISDVSITTNTSKSNGVVYINNCVANLTNVTASGNVATKGGVIYTSNDNTQLTLNSCSVTNNVATYGGVVYADSANVQIVACELTKNQATYGGVVYMENANITATGSTMTENTASNGGAVHAKDGIVQLSDCTFSGNTATVNGGAAYFYGTEVSADGTTFDGNSAVANGGAMDLVGAVANVTDDCRFANNTAVNHGGAVYVTYIGKTETTDAIPGVLNMTGGTFSGNTALGGGAVSARTGCEAHFDGTTFTGNSVSGFADEDDGDGDGGGAIYVGFGTVTLTDVTATGNNATGYGGFLDSYNATVTVTGGSYTENKANVGGAFSAPGKSTLTITNATISNNESVYENTDYDNTKGGGAIAMVKGTLTISGSTLDGNKTDYYGGALLISGATVTIDNQSVISGSVGSTGAAMNFSNKCDVTITDVSLTNNVSDFNGVVYVSNCTVAMTNVTATGNEAYKGGVIYTSNANTVITVEDSTMTGNSATNGGTLFAENANVTYTNCVLSGNSATNGSALYGESATITVTDCELKDNAASSSGAVFVKRYEKKNGETITYGVSPVLTVTGGTMSGNSASSGGAIYAHTATVTIDGTEFAGNTAKAGGAVNTVNSTISIKDATFTGNEATGNGGAAYCSGGTATLSAVTFAENTAGSNGGAMDIVGATVTMTDDCSFTDNVATNHGGAVYVTYISKTETTAAIPGVLNMTGGSFTGNTALAGGAVSARTGCEAHFDGTTFDGNSVSGFAGKDDGDGDGGGAIYVGYGTATLTDITATGNTATGHGGFLDTIYSTVTVTGGSYTENKANAGGAFSAPNGSTLTVSGATFTENESVFDNAEYDTSMGGGAIAMNKGTLSISASTFDGNKTDYYGGAILAADSTVTISGGTVVKNTSGGTGAALYFREGCTVTIEDSTIQDNTASLNGVVYTSEGTLDMTNVTASGNSALAGGVVNVSGGGAAALTDCTFSDNSATNGGVVYVNSGANATVTGGTYSKNTAQLGGAFYVAGTLETVGATYSENSAAFDSNGKNGNGGAIIVVAGTVNGTGSNIFTGNTAEGHGGAIYVSYTSNEDGTKNPGVLNMTDGLFESNTAKAGGAISARTSCEVTLTGTQLNKNHASAPQPDGMGGGAIYSNNGAVTLSGVTLQENTAAYYGGALYTIGTVLTMTDDCVVDSNSAVTGTAMWITVDKGQTTALTDLKLINNLRSAGSSNGTIYAKGNGTLNITNLTASGNVSTNGGVLYTSGSLTVTMADSTLTDNEALTVGGALSYRGGGTMTVANTTMSGNTAPNGGAIEASGSGTLTIQGCTLESNTATQAGGAVYANAGGKVVITDATTIKSNTAPKGGAIFIDNGASVTITDSTLDSNAATGGDGGAILVADTNPSDEDPAVHEATTLTMTGVTLQNNTASSKGGALSTDTDSPNLVIHATNCTFDKNAALGAGAGAVEIMNGNSTTAEDPAQVKLVFTNCAFTGNTAKTTGGAIEIRTSSCAKFDGITATDNTAKSNGGVIYVTSNYSRVYLTGDVTQSGNSSTGGTFIHLYNSSYSNPPKLYTTHSSSAAWYANVGGNRTNVAFDMTTLP